MPSPVKNRKIVSIMSEPAKALNSEARLASSKGLRPTRSPIGPAESAPTMMPMLDHRKAVVKAGPGRFQAWVKDGTVMPIELTSYPSQICTRAHRPATRICKPPIRWFSSAVSVLDRVASAISSLLPGLGAAPGSVQDAHQFNFIMPRDAVIAYHRDPRL